jgi:hypothetical protein
MDKVLMFGVYIVVFSKTQAAIVSSVKSFLSSDLIKFAMKNKLLQA